MLCYRAVDITADEEGGGRDGGDEKIMALRKTVGTVAKEITR